MIRERNEEAIGNDVRADPGEAGATRADAADGQEPGSFGRTGG
jgi:hypothetical protein